MTNYCQRTVVVDTLTSNTDPKICISYCYCDYSQADTLETTNILGTIIKQLLGKTDIPGELEQKIDRCYKDGVSGPSFEQLDDILVSAVALFSKVYIVLDGLDECSRQERKEVLSTLQKLGELETVIKVFIASRDEIDIRRAFAAECYIHVSEDDITPDVTRFVKEAVALKLQSGELVVCSDTLVQDIVTALVNGARGMSISQF